MNGKKTKTHGSLKTGTRDDYIDSLINLTFNRKSLDRGGDLFEIFHENAEEICWIKNGVIRFENVTTGKLAELSSITDDGEFFKKIADYISCPNPEVGGLGQWSKYAFLFLKRLRPLFREYLSCDREGKPIDHRRERMMTRIALKYLCTVKPAQEGACVKKELERIFSEVYS